MKKLIFVILALGLFTSAEVALAQKTGSLTVNFKAINTREGYDNLTKAELYCDGQLIGTSPEAVQSQINSVTASAPAGKHAIHLLLYAFYDGVWEVRTKENGYSLDWQWKGDVKVGKKTIVNIQFDVEEETVKKVKKLL